MNKKFPILFLTIFALVGCAKTRLLYDENAYNYPQFDKNYYVEWEGVNNLPITETKYSETGSVFNLCDQNPGDPIRIGSTVYEEEWIGNEENSFGYKHNLAKTEKKFSYGMTSKLFDGLVWCNGLYQKSRIQLDKTGFAMFFPKILGQAKYLGFACRGGTTLEHGFNKGTGQPDPSFNFTWSFYIHLSSDSYRKVIFTLNDVHVPTDSGGETTFINFTPFFNNEFKELIGAVAMSFEWEMNDSRFVEQGLTDNYKDETKEHLCVMLYEMFIGDSVWN